MSLVGLKYLVVEISFSLSHSRGSRKRPHQLIAVPTPQTRASSLASTGATPALLRMSFSSPTGTKPSPTSGWSSPKIHSAPVTPSKVNTRSILEFSTSCCKQDRIEVGSSDSGKLKIKLRPGSSYQLLNLKYDYGSLEIFINIEWTY